MHSVFVYMSGGPVHSVFIKRHVADDKQANWISCPCACVHRLQPPCHDNFCVRGKCSIDESIDLGDARICTCSAYFGGTYICEMDGKLFHCRVRDEAVRTSSLVEWLAGWVDGCKLYYSEGENEG